MSPQTTSTNNKFFVNNEKKFNILSLTYFKFNKRKANMSTTRRKKILKYEKKFQFVNNKSLSQEESLEPKEKFTNKKRAIRMTPIMIYVSKCIKSSKNSQEKSSAHTKKAPKRSPKNRKIIIAHSIQYKNNDQQNNKLINKKRTHKMSPMNKYYTSKDNLPSNNTQEKKMALRKGPVFYEKILMDTDNSITLNNNILLEKKRVSNKRDSMKFSFKGLNDIYNNKKLTSFEQQQKSIQFSKCINTPTLENKKTLLNGGLLPMSKKNAKSGMYQFFLLAFFKQLSYKEKKIFSAISFLSEKRGEFYVSQSKLAKLAGCHRNTVNSFIKKLKDIGININQRRISGRFSTCICDFDHEFRKILNYFVRFKFFKNILLKNIYQKEIKKRIHNIKKLLTRYESFEKIIESWINYKNSNRTRQIVHGGCPYNKVFNNSYKSSRFIKNMSVISNVKKKFYV